MQNLSFQELNKLQAEKFYLLVDKDTFASTAQDGRQKWKEALFCTQASKQRVAVLEQQLTQTQHAAQYLAAQAKTKCTVISQEACHKETESLK